MHWKYGTFRSFWFNGTYWTYRRDGGDGIHWVFWKYGFNGTFWTDRRNGFNRSNGADG